MDGSAVVTLVSAVVGILACGLCCIICRVWKRNRYYKKVQHSLDEEERAFQECVMLAARMPARRLCGSLTPPFFVTLLRTLARSYNDDQQLDGGDHEKLQMLETYLQMQAAGGEAELSSTADAELEMPTRAEDVDKFMRELAEAAAGGMPPVDENRGRMTGVTTI